LTAPRGVPDPEEPRLRAGEASLAQEVPACARFRRLQQLVVVELCRDPVCLQQAAALAQPDTVTGPAALFVAQLHPEFAGQTLDGLGEGQVVDLLHEGDDVPTLTA